jgi:hypothetical protein
VIEWLYMECHVSEWLQTGFGLVIGFLGLLCNTWLHLTNHYHRQTGVHSLVFTSRCSVAASNGGCSPSSGFPNYPQPQLPASNSNGSLGLNLSSSLSNSPTNYFTQLNSIALIKPSRFVFASRFLVTDPNNVLCLRPYRLANIPQLTHCFNWFPG